MEQFIKLPLSTCIGGLNHQVDLLVVFTYDEETFSINYQKLVGFSGGEMLNYNGLEKAYGEMLTKLIWGNRENWNNEELWYRSDTLSRLSLV